MICLYRKLVAWIIIVSMILGAEGCSTLPHLDNNSSKHFPSPGEPSGSDALSSSTNMSGKEDDTAPKLDPLSGAVYLAAPQIGNYGSVSFSYPISIPASRAFKPSVGLSYSSSGGDGLCGIGWSMSSGLAVISRTTSNGELYYDYRDTFTFNGRRLVKTGGSASSEEGVYRCEIESDFTRFELKNSSSGGVWYATDKSGAVTILGESTESRVYRPDNRVKTYIWNFTRSFDLNGNTVRAVYDMASYNENHVLYLSEIRYGGTSSTLGNRLSDLQWVKFNYKSRDDAYVSKAPGFIMKMDRLLDEIVIGWDDPRAFLFTATKLWNYNLVYETSEDSERPLLKTVMSSKHTTNPEFIYQKANHTLAWQKINNIWSQDSELDPQKTRYFEGDFNGDGISDMLFFNPETGNWKAAEGTRTGGYTFKTYANGYKDFNTGDEIQFFKGNVSGDYNGDGRSDVAFYLPASRDFIIAEHNGSVLNFKNYGRLPSYISDIFSCEWFCGDYDGNGLSDVMLFDEKNGQWTLMLNKGGSFEFKIVSKHLKNIFRSDYSPDSNLDSASTMDDSHTGNARGKVHFLSGDYNGDGRTDISFYDERTGDWIVGALRQAQGDSSAVSAQGAVSGYVVEWIKYGTSTSLGDRGSMLFGNDRFSGDFNGDGFSDFLWYDRASGNWWIGETGNRSINFRIFTRMPDYIRTGTNITRWLQGDFNGDGKTDIGFYSADDGNFWIGEASVNGFRFRIYTNISYGGPDGARVLAKAPLPEDEVQVMTLKQLIRNGSSSVLAEFPYDSNPNESSGEKVFAGSFSGADTKELLVFDKKNNAWKLIKSDTSVTVFSNKDSDLSKSNVLILNHEKPLKINNGIYNADMIKYSVKNTNGDIEYHLLKVTAGTVLENQLIGTIKAADYDFDPSKSIIVNESESAAVIAVNDKPKNDAPVSFLRVDGSGFGEYKFPEGTGNTAVNDELKSILADARDNQGKIRLFSIKTGTNAYAYICDTATGKWYKGTFGSGVIDFSAFSGTAAWIGDESQGSLCYDLWSDGVNDILLYGTKKNGALSFSEVHLNANNALTSYNYSPSGYSWDGEFDHAHRAVIKNESGYAAATMGSGTISYKSLADAAISAFAFTRTELYQDIYPFNWIQGDYNGDGKTDIGFFHLKESQWYFAVTKGTVPDMISEVKNGIGGAYSFEYANSTSFDNTGGDGIPDLPMNYKVCTRMVVEDGMGRSISSAYEYKNGCAFSAFISGKKETDYFGFTDFTVRNVLGGKTVSSYNTMPYDDFRKNRALAGAVKTTSVYGTDGVEYSRTENEYTLHEIIESASQTPSYLIEPTQVKKYVKGTLSETRASNIVLENNKYELVSKSESITDHYSDSVHKETTLANESYFSYDESTNETRVTYKKNLSGSAHETRCDYEYDTRGNVTRETASYTGSGLVKPKDRSTRYEYDEYGNKTRTINDSESPVRVTETEYDSALHQYTVKESAVGDITLTTAYEINYDAAFGGAQKKTDPNGNSVYYDFDSYGRLQKQRIDTDKGIETLAEYEYAPMMAKCIQYPGDGTKKETRVYADGLGRSLQSVWSATNESGKKYAKSGAIVYDVLGRVIKKGQTKWAADGDIDTYAETALVNPTITEYDPAGRVAKVTLPVAFAGEAETSTNYTYNDPWETTVTHSIGRAKRTVKNARGLVLYVEDSGPSTSLGDRTSASMGFIYDLAGNRIKKMDLNGASMTDVIDTSLFAAGKKDTGANAVAQWRYDGFGQLIETSDPDLGYAKAEYDGFGQVVKRSDSQGRVTGFEYDKLGRLTKKTLPGTEGIVSYVYDTGVNGKGKIGSIDDSVQLKKISYDKTGRISHEEREIKRNTGAFVTDFTYDLLNRTKTIEYPEDPVYKKRIKTEYSYCAFGVTDIKIVQGFFSNKNVVSDIVYNEFGQMTSVTRGDKSKTDYEYDIRGRLTHLVTKTPDKILQDVKYNFRIDNSISSKEDSFGENDLARKVRYEYSYDGLNRLADAKGSYLEGTDSTKAKTYTHSYSYSLNGNINTKNIDEAGDSWKYSYTNHAVQSVYSTKSGNRFSMRYDDSGNMIEQIDAVKKTYKQMEYDSSNRLIKASDTEKGKTLGEYEYDDQGFRVRKVAAEIINGSEALVEVLYPSMYFAIEKQKTPDGQDIPNTSYAINNIYLNGIRVAASLPDGECQYYHTDQVDSVNIITDDKGGIVDRFEYEEFGTVWQTNGTGKNRPKYTSAEFDAETELYYMNARHQNPELGRFLTADNVVPYEDDTQSWNRYSYCRNNPIVYKDPTGHADQGLGDILLGSESSGYNSEEMQVDLMKQEISKLSKAKSLQKSPDSGAVPGRIKGPIQSNEVIGELARTLVQGQHYEKNSAGQRKLVDNNGTKILRETFGNDFKRNEYCATNSMFLGLATLGCVEPTVDGYKKFVSYAAEKGYINKDSGRLNDPSQLAKDYGGQVSYSNAKGKLGKMADYEAALQNEPKNTVFMIRGSDEAHVAASISDGKGSDYLVETSAISKMGMSQSDRNDYKQNVGITSFGTLKRKE